MSKNHCEEFGANVLKTSKDCLRVAEVSEKIKVNQYINLQGDEPIFPIEDLNLFINEAIKKPEEIHTAQQKSNQILITEIYQFQKWYSQNQKLLYSSRARSLQIKKVILKLVLNTYAFMHLIKITCKLRVLEEKFFETKKILK